jgi:hypothetical protein
LGKLPQIAQFYAGLFGQVEDGADGVSAASLKNGLKWNTSTRKTPTSDQFTQ